MRGPNSVPSSMQHLPSCSPKNMVFRPHEIQNDHVKEWNEKGLRFISDFYCKDTGLVLDRHNLCELYNIKYKNGFFFCYSTLIRSITFHFGGSHTICKTCNPVFPYKIALLGKKSNILRKAYNAFIEGLNKRQADREGRTCLERKWCRDIGCVREGTLSDIRLSTKNTYLQSFDYRILSRIIATNTFLYRIGRTERPLCTFYKVNNETLYHVLLECPVVQQT